MSWALYLIFLAFFFLLITRLKFFKLEGLPRWATPVFFSVKLLAAFALWWIYTHYYTDRSTADTWKYFDDGNVMYSALHVHPGDYFKMLTGVGSNDPGLEVYYHKMNCWEQQFDNGMFNDAHSMIRLNALLRAVSLGNYHIHALFFCFIAFAGLCFIYRLLYSALKAWKNITAFIIFLLPSVVFWSSGVLKEAPVLLAVGGIIFHAFHYFHDKHFKRLVFICLFSAVLVLTKFYILLALVPALTGAYLVTKNALFPVLKFCIVIFFFSGPVLALHWLNSPHDPLKLLSRKQNDFLTLAKGGTYMYNDSVVAYVLPENHNDVIKDRSGKLHIASGANYTCWKYSPDFHDTITAISKSDTSSYQLMTDYPRAGSLMNENYLHPSIASFLLATPVALVHSLFRPWPWEGKSLLLIPAVMENLFLLLLLLSAVLFFRKTRYAGLTGFCFTFSILLLLLFGLTTPVLGALVRYRIIGLLFLLPGLLLLINKDKLSAKWKWMAYL